MTDRTEILRLAGKHGWMVEESVLGHAYPDDLVLRRAADGGMWVRLYVYHDATGRIDSLIATYPRQYRERVVLIDDVEAFLKEAK